MDAERLTTWFAPVHALEFGVYIVDSSKSLIGKEPQLEITLEAVWGQIGTRRPVSSHLVQLLGSLERKQPHHPSQTDILAFFLSEISLLRLNFNSEYWTVHSS